MFWQISAVIITAIATAENVLDKYGRVVENSGEIREVTQTVWNGADENVESITSSYLTHSANASDSLQLNGTECDSVIPHCEKCQSITADDKHCKYCRRDELERESLEETCMDCDDQVHRNSYWQDRNVSDWKCLQCEWGHAVNNNQSECIVCKEAIDNCTECSNQDGEIVCSLCDAGFYVDRDNEVDANTSCNACDTAIDNCYTCEFEGKEEESTELVCTECHFGFYFDYYRDCLACNETMPRCTNCSSFEACQIFGPVQNLTCHECEDDYYVAEDQASCKIDCRNISRLCENCTLGEEGECSACSADAYMNISGKCQACKEAIDNCTECSNQDGEIVCSLCDAGFYVDHDGVDTNTSCKARSDSTQHCGDVHEHSDNVHTASVTGEQCEGQMRVCGVPPPPPYRGGYAYTGIQYGDTATYDCECGYDLVGDQVLACNEAGQWGQAPCCTRKMLGLSLVSLHLGSRDLSDEETVTELDTLGNSINVRVLDMYRNRLSKVPPLTQYRQLDTLHHVRLGNQIHSFMWEDFPSRTQEILLHSNQLMVLPVFSQYNFCLNVKYLDLSINKLESISNEQIPPTVEILHLSGNNLVDVSDLSHCKHLTELYLDTNELTTIPLFLPPSLLWLYLDANRITEIGDLRHLDKLTHLILNKNQLTAIPLFLPPNLTKLHLRENRITEIGDLRHLDKLTHLRLPGNQLTTIPPFLPPNLTELHLGKNSITGIEDLRHLDKLTHLHLNKNQLTIIPSFLPPNLTLLYLGKNRITEIEDLRHLDKLTHLNLDKNQLTTIPSFLPPNLTLLYLGKNRITEIEDLRHLDKLTHLNLDKNQLTTIPSFLPPNLTLLYLDANKISEIGDFGHLDKLTRLILANNQLTTIPLFLPPNLTGLFLNNNRITEIGNLSYLDKLTHLLLTKNKLTTIPLFLPPSLTKLHLGANRISDWSNLTLLEKNCPNLQVYR